MDTRVLALCELSNDLLYHKIPKRQLPFYVDESLRMGTAAAAVLKGQSIEELYREHRIEICCQEDGKGAFGMAYRGQITLAKEGCSVMIFESSVRELAEYSYSGGNGGSSGNHGNIGNCGMEPVDYQLAKEIHLAHEFFHFLEFESLGYVSKLLPEIVTMEVFGLKRRAAVNRCSEVAAHAFAKELLSLKVLPNYYDYRYLINTGKMSEMSFGEMTDKYGNVLNRNEADKMLEIT